MIVYKVFVPLKLILIFVSYSVQIFIQENILILFQVNNILFDGNKFGLFALNKVFKFFCEYAYKHSRTLNPANTCTQPCLYEFLREIEPADPQN